MRYLILSFFMVLSILVYGQRKPSAEQVLKEATATAAKQNKNVFIIFHASWCGWCHKMDTAMNDKSVKAFFENNYVIRHLTVQEFNNREALENPGAEEMLAKYNGQNQGIPYWLIFDNKGKILFDSKKRPQGGGLESGDNVGCPGSEEEVGYFVSVLKQSSKLKDAELDIIYKVFRRTVSGE